jgi:hypothetical protein
LSGLVGGHCKAQEVGHHPELILAGRRINDGMGEVVASRLLRMLISRGLNVPQTRVLVLGFTFKENCPDIRNTRVIDVVRDLAGYGIAVDVHDPWADPQETEAEYGSASSWNRGQATITGWFWRLRTTGSAPRAQIASGGLRCRMASSSTSKAFSPQPQAICAFRNNPSAMDFTDDVPDYFA